MLPVRWELNPYMLCFRLLREGRQRSARRHSNLILVGVHVFQFNESQFEPDHRRVGLPCLYWRLGSLAAGPQTSYR